MLRPLLRWRRYRHFSHLNRFVYRTLGFVSMIALGVERDLIGMPTLVQLYWLGLACPRWVIAPAEMGIDLY